MKTAQKEWLLPNLPRKGRVIRGVAGLILLAAAAATYEIHWALTLALGLAGIFVLFEAARGWCVLRACRIRTPF